MKIWKQPAGSYRKILSLPSVLHKHSDETILFNHINNKRTMIRLNVFVRVNETNREKAIEAAKELTACSLKEEGCIAYDTFESPPWCFHDLRNMAECWSIGSTRKNRSFCTIRRYHSGISWNETGKVWILNECQIDEKHVFQPKHKREKQSLLWECLSLFSYTNVPLPVNFIIAPDQD